MSESGTGGDITGGGRSGPGAIAPANGTALTPVASLTEKGLGYKERPHSIEAEQALLGALLVDNEAFFRVSDLLTPEHFYEPLHARIYKAVTDLVGRGHTATPLTIAPYLARDPALEELGGPDYLVGLAAASASGYLALDYGRIVHDLALRRGLITIGEQMVAEAYEVSLERDPEDLIVTAEEQLFRLSTTGRAQGGFKDFKVAVHGAHDMALKAYEREGHLSGLSTGLSDLDQFMGGLQSSDLLILAGRPGMGKTALACNIGFNVAKGFVAHGGEAAVQKGMGGRVGFFSLEMSAEQLAMRLLAEESRVASSKLRTGDFSEEEYRRVAAAVQMIDVIPLMIDDTGGLPIAALAARARRQKQLFGLDLLIVDYLQLVTASNSRRFDSRVQEISEVTQALKALAKELNIPVLALSQLSRQVEQRPDKRPQLSDLRESGSIEQDADIVMFVYREEYYLNLHKPDVSDVERWQAYDADLKKVEGLAELIIGKQRHGPTGTVKLFFDPSITRFGDYVPADHLPERYG
ncbi:MAG: replicative DNA helicase [Alphaproteobacteria bacterium]|nr:replicative DNA helicase [Alphaproteobacteria bacterium]